MVIAITTGEEGEEGFILWGEKVERRGLRLEKKSVPRMLSSIN